MKHLMLSTAVLAAMAAPLMAQDTAVPSPFRAEVTGGEVNASDLIGATVYAAQTAYDAPDSAGAQGDWENIGSVGDIVLSRDGAVQAVLVDIGGFLGIGAREVAVDMSALRFVSDSATANDPDDWFLVMTADRATLEAAPVWPAAMTGTADTAPATPAPSATTDAAGQTAPTVPADGMTVEAPREPVLRDGYATVERTALTAEMLTGATAYDTEDNSVGSVSDLVLTAEGQITDVIIDVGGFLGIGAKPVALTLDQVDILRDTDGDTVRVYVPMTKDQLTALPKFES